MNNKNPILQREPERLHGGRGLYLPGSGHETKASASIVWPFPGRSSLRWRGIAGVVSVALLLWLAGLGIVQGAISASGSASVSASGSEADTATPNPPIAHSGLLLIGLEPSISPTAADQIFVEAGLIPVRHWPEFGLAAARLPASDDSRSPDAKLAAAANQLRQRPGVRYVENDYAIEAAAHRPPNDPAYPEQWALARINMPEAWDATAGDPTIVVALIDSGIDLQHEDLTETTLWINETEQQGIAGEDDDGNGYVDDFVGWDWVESDNQIEDPFGHGTHVGGILTAGTNNGVGVASVGRNLTLMPLRVLDERGTGFISYLVDAIAYARRKGARIVNLSLVLRIDSVAVSDSVQAFVETGGLIVAATGNFGNQVYWPAAYTETIAVAATTVDDSRSSFSNRGPETDLAAPGSLVLSTYLDNGYFLNDGTSMAVPHVSALAALVWSLRPDWDWLQVKNHLKATAADVNAAILPGPDEDIGYGRIDAEAALVQAGAGVSFTVDYREGQYTRVDQLLPIPVQLTVTDTDGSALPVVGALVHYELYRTQEIASSESEPTPLLSGTITTSTSGRGLFDIQLPSEVGEYELRIRMAGHEHRYPLTLQDGPLIFIVDAGRPVMTVGNEQTQLLFSAQTGVPQELLKDPLFVELTTSLGTFADGSQRRSLWLLDGLLVETLVGGTEAGVAEIVMRGAGQTQRTFVTIRPGPIQRISGPTRFVAQDWGDGVTVPIRLDLRDEYGNPLWDNTRVNFYALNGTFAPQSPAVALGRVETYLDLPLWAPTRIGYWALVPGTFSMFQGEVMVLRHHLWLPTVTGASGPAEQ